MTESSPAPDDGRWPAVFRRAREPLFVLNRNRKLIFANTAWEALTGHSFADVRGMACTRRKRESELNELSRTLAPPKDVMDGRAASVRRPFPGTRLGPPWWDIDFLPLAGESSPLAIVGRVRAPAVPPLAPRATMPAEWARIRAEAIGRYSWSAWESDEAAVRRAVSQARLIASAGCNAVLCGPRGVGKEHLARTIHAQSSRRELTCLALDCARLPAGAVQAVLTGPQGLTQMDRVGLVYIHRPDLLPLDFQQELARTLTGQFPVMGGFESDPRQAVIEGRLLSDLHVALAVVVIELPPLRERKNDIQRLADVVVTRFAAAGQRPAKLPDGDAREVLASASWPGNLDELASTLADAMDRADDAIAAAALPLEMRQPLVLSPVQERPWPTLDALLETVERRMIARALERAQGNKARAAELLGVWRPRLVRRIAALGLGPAEETP